MPITSKRISAPTLLAVSTLFVGALLTGCSSDSEAASSDESPSASAPAGSAFEQVLAYAKCMRENGVADYPDPKQDSDGRVQVAPGEGVDMTSKEYQKAEEACQDLMPQGQGGSARGGEIDSAKVAKWAKCIRENGVPKLPDPEIEGNQLVIDPEAAGISPSDDSFNKAQQACMDKSPGGSLILRPGGAQ